MKGTFTHITVQIVLHRTIHVFHASITLHFNAEGRILLKIATNFLLLCHPNAGYIDAYAEMEFKTKTESN